jgi:ubiquinone/menaquinone biosynthesis C-methylase UbiE
MAANVDLYNTSYSNSEHEVYSQIRRETYGADLGLTSWVSAEEIEEIPRLLRIDSSSHVLEIGFGAGGCALHFAAKIGCRVSGIDVNPNGVRAAEHLARARKLQDRVKFIEHNAAAPLPFPDQAFDAAYSNDAFCHIPNRLRLLRECRRALKPGARLLFSDALVVSGSITNEEIATRSSIGYYVFVPLEENERLLREAGFTLVSTIDATERALLVSEKWRNARAQRKAELLKLEEEANFEGLQKFLDCVHTLTSEKRLSRFVYVAATQDAHPDRTERLTRIT